MIVLGGLAVSTHSRAEAAAIWILANNKRELVSTHSRAEAAAILLIIKKQEKLGFNTQPRGGGCTMTGNVYNSRHIVSTHSRAEAAACERISKTI